VALEVLCWCGCRISDGRRLGPDHVDAAGWLAFVQQKTGGPVCVPFARALPDFAVAEDLALRRCVLTGARLATRPGHARTDGG